MTHTFNFQRTEAYLAARDVAVMVHRAGIRDTELRDQATRASKSCFLNLSEGLPSTMAGVRRRHFAIALGSLGETSAALDLAVAIGAIDEDAARDAAIARTAALVGGLRRARRRSPPRRLAGRRPSPIAHRPSPIAHRPSTIHL